MWRPMNKVPPAKRPPDRRFERRQPIPPSSPLPVRRAIDPVSVSQAAALTVEVETWVNEGGAGDEPDNLPARPIVAK